MSPRRWPIELVVKLVEGDALIDETPEGELSENGSPFTRLAGTLPGGARIRQSFPRLARRLRAARQPLSRPGGGRSLDRFLRVRLPDDTTDVLSVLRALRAHPFVEQAVLALPTRRACPVSVGSLVDQEDYLAAAPIGVNAKSLWEEADGSGARACVCDTTYAAHHRSLPHVELLTDAAMPTLPPSNDPDAMRHGTAALGVVGARCFGDAEDRGTKGIAFGARLAFSAVPENDSLSTAIDRALGETDGAGEKLGRGDVLVIEQEAFLPSSGTDKWVLDGGDYAPTAFPAEVNPDVFRAIQVAVGAGVTVVEAAGNGCGSLKGWYEGVDALGDYFEWDPEDDSGAILVGGGVLGDDGATRVRWETFDGTAFHGTNYGPRVDCHASASPEVTPCCPAPAVAAGDLLGTDPGDPADTTAFARWFNATSAATAIIGGVATLFQSAHRARTGMPGGIAGVGADPEEIRAWLRADANGTPQTFRSTEADPAHRIGPQPDCESVLDALPATALVMLKDDLADVYARAERFLKFRCPDILVPPRGPPPPPFDHPEMRNRDLPPADAAPGGRVLVRVHNRTPIARDVQVALWWSEPAPFLHPKFWKSLGSVVVDGVAAGDVKVTRPWLLPDSTPAGPRSWIAAIGEEDHPLRLDARSSTSEFLELLHRSVTLRMLNRQRQPLVWGESLPFRMHLRGMPEGDAVHELRFASTLPVDTVVVLEAEQPLLGHAMPFRTTLAELVEQPLRLHLAPSDDVPVRVRLRPPRGAPFPWTAMTIDQVVDGRQLGRMSFEVTREKPPPEVG